MGKAKEMMIEMEQDPFYGVSERLVSAHLFNNRLVHEFVLGNGFDGVCSYCGNMTKVLPLKSIVEEIDRIILQYYGEPDNEGVGWDSGFENDAPGFHSECGGYIVPNNKPYYDDMHELLLRTGFKVKDDDLEHDISDALSYHFCLIEKDPYGVNAAEERWIDWSILKKRAEEMATAGRSLDEMLRAEAARLHYIKSDIQTTHYPFQVKKGLTLYRSVNYKKRRRPLLFIDLTSPPVQFTREMRMSKKGDAVFYAAENQQTAKQEAINDAEEGYCYLGKFETTHQLHLLDLTHIPEQLTIFDQEQFLVLLFLQNFCEAISEYVPDHDAVKYAPTQLLTYFFRYKLRHYEDADNNYPIDGILYTSSKEGNTNAVLFFDNEKSREHLKLVEWECIHQGSSKVFVYKQKPKWMEAIIATVRKLWTS